MLSQRAYLMKYLIVYRIERRRLPARFQGLMSKVQVPYMRHLLPIAFLYSGCPVRIRWKNISSKRIEASLGRSQLRLYTYVLGRRVCKVVYCETGHIGPCLDGDATRKWLQPPLCAVVPRRVFDARNRGAGGLRVYGLLLLVEGYFVSYLLR